MFPYIRYENICIRAPLMRKIPALYKLLRLTDSMGRLALCLSIGGPPAHPVFINTDILFPQFSISDHLSYANIISLPITRSSTSHSMLSNTFSLEFLKLRLHIQTFPAVHNRHPTGQGTRYFYTSLCSSCLFFFY